MNKNKNKDAVLLIFKTKSNTFYSIEDSENHLRLAIDNEPVTIIEI